MSEDSSDNSFSLTDWIILAIILAVVFGPPIYYGTLEIRLLMIAFVLGLLGMYFGRETRIVNSFKELATAFAILVGIGLVVYFGAQIFRYAIVDPLVSLVETALAAPYLTGASVLSLAGIVLVASLYTGWKTGPAVNWSLTLRMIVSILLLAGLTVVFFVAVWRIVYGTIEFSMSIVGLNFASDSLIENATLVWLLIAFSYHALDQIATVDQQAGAVTVSSEEEPTLHALTNTVATQLDIPVPTVAVSEASAPMAMTRGYRPGTITLVLSRGTLDALSENELRAVIAHELSHVANMDAMVMSVASLPLVLTDGLKRRTTDALSFGDSGTESIDTGQGTSSGSERGLPGRILWVATIIPLLVIVVLLLPLVIIGRILGAESLYYSLVGTLALIALLTKYASLPIIGLLSRARESVADRTAATVTGSPAALATALRTLDERIAETPTEDLREVSGPSSLSILPLTPVSSDSDEGETIGLIKMVGALLIISGREKGVLGDIGESLASDDREPGRVNTAITEVKVRLKWLLFATHPPTTRRIDALQSLADGQETAA